MILKISPSPFTVSGPHLFRDRLGELANDKELKTLRAAQARVVDLYRQLGDLGANAEKAERQKLRDAYAAHPSDQNLAALKSQATPQIDTARTAVKEAMKRENAELLPLITRIYERARKLVAAEIATLAEEEKKTADRYRVDFAGSPTLGALQNLARNLSLPPEGGRTTPSAMVSQFFQL